jgi:hypothetical protein
MRGRLQFGSSWMNSRLKLRLVFVHEAAVKSLNLRLSQVRYAEWATMDGLLLPLT